MGAVYTGEEIGGVFSSPLSSSCYSGSSPNSSSGANCIEHQVSKMDTLAGIAIKYGVEVADIKRMNSLVTDLQMFAHKSLKIPLPGRHPPSPVQTVGATNNGVETPPRHPHTQIVESFESLKLNQRYKISPAMSSLQRHYSPKPPRRLTDEGTEMSVYRTGNDLRFEDDSLPKVSPVPDAQLTGSTSPVSNVLPQYGELCQDLLAKEAGDSGDPEKSKCDKSVRRRQKCDFEPLRMPLLLVKEESADLGGRAVKAPLPRTKLGSRTDMDFRRSSTDSAEDNFILDRLSAVRKSLSTSDLQESDNSYVMRQSSKWSFTADLFSKPILDGLQKPIIAWMSKTALD